MFARTAARCACPVVALYRSVCDAPWRPHERLPYHVTRSLKRRKLPTHARLPVAAAALAQERFIPTADALRFSNAQLVVPLQHFAQDAAFVAHTCAPLAACAPTLTHPTIRRYRTVPDAPSFLVLRCLPCGPCCEIRRRALRRLSNAGAWSQDCLHRSRSL